MMVSTSFTVFFLIPRTVLRISEASTPGSQDGWRISGSFSFAVSTYVRFLFTVRNTVCRAMVSYISFSVFPTFDTGLSSCSSDSELELWLPSGLVRFAGECGTGFSVGRGTLAAVRISTSFFLASPSGNALEFR